MSSSDHDRVEDPKGRLDEDDHMRAMERLEMEVVSLHEPFPGVTRVTARFDPVRPEAWARPNVAIRINVEEPEDGRPITRIYTVRSFDPERCLIEIDFVLHDDDSPAMRWLNGTGPGETVGLIGPRDHFVPDPVPGKRVAILADDTAIPAVYAILNAWSQGAAATVWIETANRAAFDELPVVPGVTYHLLLRAPDTPPGTGRLLISAATQAVTDPRGWKLWAAGERQEMRDLRSHFFTLGFARDDIQVLGYWRHGISSSELDRMRLKKYAAIRDREQTLETLDDADLPI
ncbi:siderophore-interacting protein [Chachezhania antarctica]|uniref:siderophore-interacting protein n=1 Tax=Chachezhania antarctica TaxID=2340860 RepID=UPI0019698719|nr:siderophore-interacting protein [Chachezhania antarctica]|tara:strand:- start:1137 stop:2003 length:867 start_codon:yes stop_codon:yes gene_type:complete